MIPLGDSVVDRDQVSFDICMTLAVPEEVNHETLNHKSQIQGTVIAIGLIGLHAK